MKESQAFHIWLVPLVAPFAEKEQKGPSMSFGLSCVGCLETPMETVRSTKSQHNLKNNIHKARRWPIGSVIERDPCAMLRMTNTDSEQRSGQSAS